MRSKTTKRFREAFQGLPPEVQNLARRVYSRWKVTPTAPGLRFKVLEGKVGVYSIRIGLGWRTLCVVQDDVCIWFWIGSHDDYDKVIRTLD